MLVWSIIQYFPRGMLDAISTWDFWPSLARASAWLSHPRNSLPFRFLSRLQRGNAAAFLPFSFVFIFPLITFAHPVISAVHEVKLLMAIELSLIIAEKREIFALAELYKEKSLNDSENSFSANFAFSSLFDWIVIEMETREKRFGELQ